MLTLHVIKSYFDEIKIYCYLTDPCFYISLITDISNYINNIIIYI